MDGLTVIVDENGKITGYTTNTGGADTVFPFSSIEAENFECFSFDRGSARTLTTTKDHKALLITSNYRFTYCFDDIKILVNGEDVTSQIKENAFVQSDELMSASYIVKDIPSGSKIAIGYYSSACDNCIILI